MRVSRGRDAVKHQLKALLLMTIAPGRAQLNRFSHIL